MPSASEATSALNVRINAVFNQLQSMQGRAPTESSLTQLRTVLDRLDSGLDVAQTALQIEADAGRLATAEYRALDAALDRGSEVSATASVRLNEALNRLGMSLSMESSVGTQAAKTNQPAYDFSAAVQRVASRAGAGWVLASGAAALGLGWVVLKIIDKKRSV